MLLKINKIFLCKKKSNVVMLTTHTFDTTHVFDQAAEWAKTELPIVSQDEETTLTTMKEMGNPRRMLTLKIVQDNLVTGKMAVRII